MFKAGLFALVFTFLVFHVDQSFAQNEESRVIPTVVTNHYDESEPLSHGVVHLMSKKQKVRVEVMDLKKNASYDVVVLNEESGERKELGKAKTDKRGYASTEFSIAGVPEGYNALLVVNGEDVIQYAQLHEATHGCICKHSGGTIVTRKLDQECYECPCRVNYEICCGGRK